jgi:hypothetical protein
MDKLKKVWVFSGILLLITVGIGRVQGQGNISSGTVGGGCKYKEIPGKCHITSASNAPADQNNCPNDPVEILFDFAPNDPQAPAHYLFPKWPETNQHLLIGDGKNPPRQWTVKQGLLKDSIKPCLRTEIVQGTCTPVIFKFIEVDYSDANKLCFAKK